MCLSYGMSKLSYLRSRLAMFKYFSVKVMSVKKLSYARVRL